jgi:SAM-dependent methyltransferase
VRQREIILSRPLLKGCYDHWYSLLLADVDSVAWSDGLVVELGAGGGYLKDLRRDITTSDVESGMADRVIDAMSLPFPDSSVRALLLTHSFHHVPDVRQFLREADRVLVPGGVISMIEVAATAFARFFFSRFHPEPFLPQAPTWSFNGSHHGIDSNQALSWIVFVRDRRQFEDQFPRLAVERLTLMPWFSYLVSGGVTRRNLTPWVGEPLVRAAERLLRPLLPLLALHWHITIRKA